ncbi:MAG: hypothetical protein EBX50_16220, partial [Chitinophagia bacterium]|nr:hypothetical protein [Chitinophagia bacterium]
MSSGSIGAVGVTVGTLYATSITSSNAQLSGTISAATHVGTLISAGSIGVAGATVGTLYANSITSANIYVSGSVVSVNVTSVNVIDTNITTGTLNVSTGITSSSLLATSSMSIRTSGTLEFGYGVAGKELNAGVLGYGTFTANMLDIVGGGNTAGSRSVKIWEHLNVGTSITTGYIYANNSITTGAINTPGITAGNINFTGSLYQNGSPYSGGGSQWTTTNGNVSYTNGSVVAGTVTATNLIASNASVGTLYAT